VRQYAERDINGATAGLAYNLGIAHDAISADGALVRNAADDDDLPIGSTTYTKITNRGGRDAGGYDYDLTNDDDKLQLAKDICFEQDPRQDGP